MVGIHTLTTCVADKRLHSFPFILLTRPGVASSIAPSPPRPIIMASYSADVNQWKLEKAARCVRDVEWGEREGR